MKKQFHLDSNHGFTTYKTTISTIRSADLVVKGSGYLFYLCLFSEIMMENHLYPNSNHRFTTDWAVAFTTSPVETIGE